MYTCVRSFVFWAEGAGLPSLKSDQAGPSKDQSSRGNRGNCAGETLSQGHLCGCPAGGRPHRQRQGFLGCPSLEKTLPVVRKAECQNADLASVMLEKVMDKCKAMCFATV